MILLERFCNFLWKFDIEYFELKFIRKAYKTIKHHDNESIRKLAPEDSPDFCCSQSGVNHQARDFVRALLLRLIDKIENLDNFVEFMKENQFVTVEAYELARDKINSSKVKGLSIGITALALSYILEEMV
jgi:hypothetical protein